jgi:hypothetical protein
VKRACKEVFGYQINKNQMLSLVLELPGVPCLPDRQASGTIEKIVIFG